MDVRSKAVKAYRKRLRTRRLKRVEVTVRVQDAALVRTLAAALRRDDRSAQRARTMLRKAIGQHAEPTVAEVLTSLPDISGPEFDEVFEEIERFRHDPVMAQVRDIDL